LLEIELAEVPVDVSAFRAVVDVALSRLAAPQKVALPHAMELMLRQVLSCLSDKGLEVTMGTASIVRFLKLQLLPVVQQINQQTTAETVLIAA
jgi:hypothetical protein